MTPWVVSVVFITDLQHCVESLISYIFRDERNVQIFGSFYIVSRSANKNHIFSNFNVRAVRSFSEVRPLEYTCSEMLN